jgi:UDP-N-acetyl-D-glucosamine dehydrogenase
MIITYFYRYSPYGKLLAPTNTNPALHVWARIDMALLGVYVARAVCSAITAVTRDFCTAAHPSATCQVFQMSNTSALSKELLSKIKTFKAKIGVIGMGYVGLPLAMALAEAGFNVIGFDVDAPRMAALNKGQSYLKHIPSAHIEDVVLAGRLSGTTDLSRCQEADVIIIAVPTPLTRYREPDLTYIRKTVEAVRATLRKGQLIILESTTYPGTTTEVVKPILEATGLVAGQDFFLAFSPEREDPGNAHFNTRTIPKVVGGDGKDALGLAQAVYAAAISQVVPVSSTEVAEAVKLTENIFRAVNIALVNELKVVFDRMGIDVWEVIKAADSKPFGYMAFYPGPGIGGHCIPIDPFYLTWKAREYDIATRFIELAGQINSNMPYHVVDRLSVEMDKRLGRGLSNARILMLGIAYKQDIGDFRESPALKLIELIERRGATVDFHDPFIDVFPYDHEYPWIEGRKSTPLTADALAQYDAVVIATGHTDVDYRLIVSKSKVVADTRNVLQPLGLLGENSFKC